jgi:hypothetical protein
MCSTPNAGPALVTWRKFRHREWPMVVEVSRDIGWQPLAETPASRAIRDRPPEAQRNAIGIN